MVRFLEPQFPTQRGLGAKGKQVFDDGKDVAYLVGLVAIFGGITIWGVRKGQAWLQAQRQASTQTVQSTGLAGSLQNLLG